MSEVQIEYCVPCGLLPAAEETAHALLSTLGRHIEALRMKPGHGGVFTVSVDDVVVFDKATDGFDLGAIVTRVYEGLRIASRT